MFYGAYADCSKGMQCVVAIFHILYGDELVEKLRQDFLDIVSFFVGHTTFFISTFTDLKYSLKLVLFFVTSLLAILPSPYFVSL